MSKKIAVIGAGAAGMTAAGFLVRGGADVTVFEQNQKPGRKLAITGKGRCNLTNNCQPDEFLRNVVTNSRFLMSAVNRFTPNDTMELIESLGVPLKTERGNRVFPCSDNAFDIVDALKKFMKVKPVCEKAEKIEISDGHVTGLVTDRNRYAFDSVIVATGGISYPSTGSRGDGYRFALEAGHTVTALIPSLVPIETIEKEPEKMQGLSLKNVKLCVYDTKKKKTLFCEQGEMMFTHFGVTGPLVLSASSNLHDMESGRYLLKIDLKPALDEKKLDVRLLSDFSKYSNRDFINSLVDLLPSKMIPVFVSMCGIAENKKVNSITKEERRRMIGTLKEMTFTVKGFRPIEEAIVTSGGVAVKQVDPKTMQSKLISGLYFAGEVLDLDAYTGGFNLQIAFSTAAAAARGILEE